MNKIDQNTTSAGELLPEFKPDTPFLLQGCMVIRCIGGTASFSLNFRNYVLKRDDYMFLFSDMVVMLLSHSDDFKIQYVNISAPHSFDIYMSVTSSSFWDTLYLYPLQQFKDSLGRFVDQCMDQSLYVAHTCSGNVPGDVIFNMTISLYRVLDDIFKHDSRHIENPDFSGNKWKITGEFYVLLAHNYMSKRSVAFYAGQLNVTPDYLSTIIKQCTGMTPKETIEGRIVLAIKAFLSSSNLTVKQIAERLHFEDTSHLCRVFRRNTGMSPMQYRRGKQ